MAAQQSVEKALAALTARVRALEDELAITRVLTSYGLTVDSDDADGCADLYTDDAVVTIDDEATFAGREQIRTIVTCDEHQAILPGCAHVMGPFVIRVDSDRAVATGYATIFTAGQGQREVLRQSFGRWELSRIDNRWRITNRAAYAMGHLGGSNIARRATTESSSAQPIDAPRIETNETISPG